MKPRARPIAEELARRLRTARKEVWRTVVRTDAELATLEAHQAGAPGEDAGTLVVADVLARLDGAGRHQLDEIDAAQARLAAGTFGACEGCRKAIPLARLRAVPTARLCVVCQRASERPASA
ncbi:MAG TPA: TraR/DksA family transcriptional regulator [Methylomirabilota bacterium]|nr:TraR/DksA family transcriptional regulator [Methylomirabilota bacterium]